VGVCGEVAERLNAPHSKIAAALHSGFVLIPRRTIYTLELILLFVLWRGLLHYGVPARTGTNRDRKRSKMLAKLQPASKLQSAIETDIRLCGAIPALVIPGLVTAA